MSKQTVFTTLSKDYFIVVLHVHGKYAIKINDLFFILITFYYSFEKY